MNPELATITNPTRVRGCRQVLDQVGDASMRQIREPWTSCDTPQIPDLAPHSYRRERVSWSAPDGLPATATSVSRPQANRIPAAAFPPADLNAAGTVAGVGDPRRSPTSRGRH